jgi:SAM-dependent methyltransferase
MRSPLDLVRRAARRLVPRPDHVRVDGTVIPAPDRRWCGPEFKDDTYYLRSAEAEAERLTSRLGYTAGSRVLDVGCGQGRLAIGMVRVLGAADYTGLDVHRRSVEWCRRHIEREHPSFRFRHLDVQNDRYNPRGAPLGDSFRFDLEDASADIIYLYSVFSHTTEADMRLYLREFRRLLAPGGRVFFTTFVEADVPEYEVNPANERLPCCGPLHMVRYQREYLFGVLAECGFAVVDFNYDTDGDGQSAIYLA